MEDTTHDIEKSVEDQTHNFEETMEDKLDNPEVLKNEEESLPETKVEDFSDNSRSADHAAVPDNSVLPLSDSDNSELISEKQSENISVEEEMKGISIKEPIQSSGEDSKGTNMTSETPMHIETDKDASSLASCDLNIPGELSSSDSLKLSPTKEECCIESDDVRNYETEDDDLKVLEAFIVKSATNPEIAVCQTKQSEENSSKYSLESSLLDDLTKTDEVESVTNDTKSVELLPTEVTSNSTIKSTLLSESTSDSSNSKLQLPEDLEGGSPEISAPDNSQPVEVKTRTDNSFGPASPKSSVGEISSSKKIADLEEMVCEKHEDMSPNLATKNISEDLTLKIVKRGRGRPPGSGKKSTLEKKLMVQKLQKIKRTGSQIPEKVAIEKSPDIVGKEGKSLKKVIKNDSDVKSSRMPQAPEKNSESSESSEPLHSNRRKRKLLEIKRDSPLRDGAKRERFPSYKRKQLNDAQNAILVHKMNVEKKQNSTISASKQLSEIEKISRKRLLPRFDYPICMSALTYSQLKSKAKEIALPSPLWSVHIDAARDCIAYLRTATDISESKMIIEKSVLFEMSLKPVLLLKNEPINVPYPPLDNLEDVVLLLENFHNLQICEGTAIKQRAYSKYCYKFVDVANTDQRCSQCIEERRRVLFSYINKLREKISLLEN